MQPCHPSTPPSLHPPVPVLAGLSPPPPPPPPDQEEVWLLKILTVKGEQVSILPPPLPSLGAPSTSLLRCLSPPPPQTEAALLPWGRVRLSPDWQGLL